MGIEGVWRIAKKFYKAEVAKMMITKRSINHMELVQSCIAKVTDEQCKQEAARGWLQLLNARPRDYDSQGEVMLESDDDYWLKLELPWESNSKTVSDLGLGTADDLLCKWKGFGDNFSKNEERK